MENKGPNRGKPDEDSFHAVRRWVSREFLRYAAEESRDGSDGDRTCDISHAELKPPRDRRRYKETELPDDERSDRSDTSYDSDLKSRDADLDG